jgi:hypothetical protein
MENLGKFSVSNVVDSAPSDSLGVVLAPNGGSYSLVATSSTGGGQGGNVPKLGESDSSWQEITGTKGIWVYRRYNGVLFIKPKGAYSSVSGLALGETQILQIPQPYRDGLETAAASIVHTATKKADGSAIMVNQFGQLSITSATANGSYTVPTLAIPYSNIG